MNHNRFVLPQILSTYISIELAKSERFDSWNIAGEKKESTSTTIAKCMMSLLDTIYYAFSISNIALFAINESNISKEEDNPISILRR